MNTRHDTGGRFHGRGFSPGCAQTALAGLCALVLLAWITLPPASTPDTVTLTLLRADAEAAAALLDPGTVTDFLHPEDGAGRDSARAQAERIHAAFQTALE